MAKQSFITFVIATFAFLACVVIGTRLLPDGMRQLPVAQSHESPGPNYYLSTDNATTLDQLVFHHQLEDVGKSLQNADVVFAGNSRSLFGFPEAVCNKYFADRNMQWFHIGFPSENNVFTQHVLEQYDARPRLVIVNADDFFTGSMSTIARRSIHTSAFGAQKLYWESQLSFRLRHRLHKWLPHPPTMFFAAESMIVHRSRENGAWLIGETRGNPVAISMTDTEKTAAKEHIRIAKQFKQFVEDRGGKLVLTYVPSKHNHRNRAALIARQIGCRFVSPVIADLKTIDGSHLDAPSARRFAKATLEELNCTKLSERSSQFSASRMTRTAQAVSVD